MRRTMFAAAALAAGALPAAAQAHVSIHPNVLPAASQPTVTLRVPNEESSADTLRIAVQMPPGVLDVSPAPPPGWTVTLEHRKLPKPIKTGDGTVTEEVSEVDISGGHIKPEQSGLFPMAISVPGKAGDVLSFKTVQTCTGGKVVRWIGPADSDQPAPTVDVISANGAALDIAGDAGPPATLPASLTGGSTAKPAAPARVIDERYVDRVAGRHNISLRTGCFCNPGAGEIAFTISRETLVGGEFGEGMTLEDYIDQIGLPSGGAIRASLGLASNLDDLRRFVEFAGEFVDLTETPGDLPPRTAC